MTVSPEPSGRAAPDGSSPLDDPLSPDPLSTGPLSTDPLSTGPRVPDDASPRPAGSGRRAAHEGTETRARPDGEGAGARQESADHSPAEAGHSPAEGRHPSSTGDAEAAPPRAERGRRRRGAPRATPALAFVESPVQLLNVLEWAHTSGAGTAPQPAPTETELTSTAKDGAGTGGGDGVEAGTDSAAVPGAEAPRPSALTIAVLSPNDPMTRGQLRRMTELVRDEGHAVRWVEAREGLTGPLKGVGALLGELRRARRILVGDPFSRMVQLLLTFTSATDVVVVDDGTATMEFVGQLAQGERFVRWHRKGVKGGGGPRAALFAPFARGARRRLTPGGRRRVEVFSSMPVEPPPGVTVTANDFSWTRERFGPPRLTRGTDLVGTSLVETGVVDTDRYLGAVAALAQTHGATRYFAHRRESNEKLQQVVAATGLEIVRPDLPLELIARRGPIGRTILSFPSTVVHTLPLALEGTPVTVAVCDVDPDWLTQSASPRAEGFLSGVTVTARGVRRLTAPHGATPHPATTTPPPPPDGPPHSEPPNATTDTGSSHGEPEAGANGPTITAPSPETDPERTPGASGQPTTHAGEFTVDAADGPRLPTTHPAPEPGPRPATVTQPRPTDATVADAGPAEDTVPGAPGAGHARPDRPAEPGAVGSAVPPLPSLRSLSSLPRLLSAPSSAPPPSSPLPRPSHSSGRPAPPPAGPAPLSEGANSLRGMGRYAPRAT